MASDNDNTWNSTHDAVTSKGYDKVGNNRYVNSQGDIIETDGKFFREEKYRIQHDSTKEDN